MSIPAASNLDDLLRNNAKIRSGALADEATIHFDKTNGVYEVADGGIGTTQLADLAVTTGKLADLAVTTAKLADNSVTTGKIAAGAVGLTDLGALTTKGDTLIYNTAHARKAVSSLYGEVLTVDSTHADGLKYNGMHGSKNKLINGAFTIWQRGTAFAAVATNAYTADRWVVQYSTTAVTTVDKVAGPHMDDRLSYSEAWKTTVTTGDAAVAVGDHYILNQYVEGYNLLAFRGRTFTLSFAAFATKTGTFHVAFRNSVGDKSYVVPFTITSASNWQRFRVTVTHSVTGTWDYTTGIGIRVTFTLMSGSTFHTTANAWQNGNFLATSAQTNFMATAGDFFALAGVQMEPGDVPTDFDLRPYGQELALCQRYYENMGGSQVVNAANVFHPYAYKVTKRANPTLTTTFGGGVGATFAVGTNGFYQSGNHSINSAFDCIADAEL